MAKAVIEAQRRLPYPPEQLCAMVGDVKSYPQFIPWVKSIAVSGETPLEGGGWQGLARAIIGWKSLQERFATHVRCAPSKGEVDVRLAEGPFKSLETRWRFSPDGEGGAKVAFWIAYEFKNPLLQGMASVNRTHAANRIMAAFEAEARRRFAPPAKA